MKITPIILALLTAGFLGHSALASDNNNSNLPLAFAVTQDGHGGFHFLYFQTGGQQDTTSVALYTSSGSVISPMAVREREQTDNGPAKLVIGTDQHGRANSAYIQPTSHFAPAGQ